MCPLDLITAPPGQAAHYLLYLVWISINNIVDWSVAARNLLTAASWSVSTEHFKLESEGTLGQFVSYQIIRMLSVFLDLIFKGFLFLCNIHFLLNVQSIIKSRFLG